MFHILAVEDDPQFNRNVCAHLQRHGYAAEGCGDGLETFDKLSAAIYDLIISDIQIEPERSSIFRFPW